MSDIGTFLIGIGTFLIGIATMIALCKTESLLTEVLKIQSQAKDIKQAIILLGEQLKKNTAIEIIESYSKLKRQDVSKEYIETALKSIPTSPIYKTEAAIFLPSNKREAAVRAILKAPVQLRSKTLQKFLKYESPENTN